MQLPRNWEEKKLNKKLNPFKRFCFNIFKKRFKNPAKKSAFKNQKPNAFFIKKNLTVYCQMTSRRKILTFQKFC